MYIERDSEFNLIYISFSDEVKEGAVARTVEVMPGVSFDLDVDDKLLGIEIFSTEEVIGSPAADLNFSGELIGAEEVAKLLGEDQADFLEKLTSRSDFPRPMISVESGDLWLSKDIEAYENLDQARVDLLGSGKTELRDFAVR